ASACSRLAWHSCCSCHWRALRFHISPRRTLACRCTSLPHCRAFSYWCLGSSGPSSISVLHHHASHSGFSSMQPSPFWPPSAFWLVVHRGVSILAAFVMGAILGAGN